MYIVTYTIDVDAGNPVEAAKKAHAVMKEQAGPSFTVKNKDTDNVYNVDLSYPDFMALDELNGKTIPDYLDELPEPYRTQALKNYDPYYFSLYTDTDNVPAALEQAFDWSHSPQKYRYWRHFHNKLLFGTSPVNIEEATRAISLREGLDLAKITNVKPSRKGYWKYTINDTEEDIYLSTE